MYSQIFQTGFSCSFITNADKTKTATKLSQAFWNADKKADFFLLPTLYIHPYAEVYSRQILSHSIIMSLSKNDQISDYDSYLLIYNLQKQQTRSRGQVIQTTVVLWHR